MKTKPKTKTKTNAVVAKKATVGKASAPNVAATGKTGKKAVQALAEVANERVKLVRDSFTMPRDDFDLIDQLKARATEFKRPAKKSELLRAGLQVLARLDQAQLRAALDALTPLKAGRPKNKH